MIQRLNSRFFLRGFGRALDIRGATSARYSPRRDWSRSDRAAVESDWSFVFHDLSDAYERVRHRATGDE